MAEHKEIAELLGNPEALSAWQAGRREESAVEIERVANEWGTSVVAIAVCTDGSVFDYLFTFETGLSFANLGWLVVATGDDDGRRMEDAQIAYDAELASAIDCFGAGHLKVA